MRLKQISRLELDPAHAKLSDTKLGQGAFADVFLGTYDFHPNNPDKPPEDVAFKVFRDEGRDLNHKSVIRELNLNIPPGNLTQMFGSVVFPDNRLALVLEYVDGGNLWSLLQESGAELT